MATINATLPTLADITSRMDPNGSIASVVEVLSQDNTILMDAVWKEGNLPTGHVFTSRVALPSGTWRMFNQGVAPSKSRTSQVTEACGMLEAYAKVDCGLAELNGNGPAFRASENSAFIQGLSNDLETAFIYSSTKTDPEKIMGLAPRLDSTTGSWGGQIIDSQIAASGSDQSSIWFVGWGPETVFGMFPKGMKSGFTEEDLGKQLTRDSGGTNEFTAWVTHYKWNVGLCVKDARYVVRLANIDTSAIAETGKLLLQDMVKSVHQLRKTGARLAGYCNKKIGTYLHLQALDSVANATLSIEKDWAGRPGVTHFLGIPMRETDGITNTEAIIT
ncbi:MAG: major capsid protein [Candidatus Acidiferrales bacterium]